ncbi:MAG: 3-dehydroquinate synthase II [bacterium]
MKRFWVDVRQWDKKLVTTALESGAEAVVVPPGFSVKVKELGIVTTVAEDGDLKPGEDVVEVTIEGKEDEERAAKAGAAKLVVVRTSDWRVIPLENLVAQCDGVIAEVGGAEEARTAVQILEKGVAGVLLKTRDPNEIKRTAEVLRGSVERFQLAEVEITGLKAVGMGDRVCVDTCTNMTVGQGLLVGNSANAMFLVHSESVENPYVAARPFRVNAGAVHAYVQTPGGKTRYLSEIGAGDEVLIVSHDGGAEAAVVGRAKVEKRPLMLVEAAVSADGQAVPAAGGPACAGAPPLTMTIMLQNAETIRLVQPGGAPVSVVELAPGRRVLAFIGGGARHFGMKIRETITEK